MSSIALVGANCEAEGHPTECTEPATGSVSSTSSNSVTINGTDVYVQDRANMHFDSHAHDHDNTNGCHDMQSHDIDPDDTHSVTINGQPVFEVGDATTDPVTGGTADVIDSGGNSSVTRSP